ncbi:MAG: hypothetical protein ACM3XN_04755 [Chloroflexota bacterium]
MIGVLPLPSTAPASCLADFRWWYVAPGRLFGLRLDGDGRPLEVAFGTAAMSAQTGPTSQPTANSRPTWCPADAAGGQGYVMAYAPFPLNPDQSRPLTPQPGDASAGWRDETVTGRGPESEALPGGESPARREEVDLSVQLQFPVCSFLSEARGDLRLHAECAARGQMIMTRSENRVGVTTTVHNLLPLFDPLPPGLYFYEAWLEQVDEDGTVRVAVPVGAISVSDDGTGTGFREVDGENVGGTGLPIEAFNGTAITAQARDGSPGQSEYTVLEGTLPRTVRW